MTFIENKFDILDAKDLKVFKDKRIVFYNELDFTVSYMDNLWINVTREDTTILAIGIDDSDKDKDEIRRTIIEIKTINKNFNNALDVHLIFKTNKYEKFITGDSKVVIEDDYSRDELKQLLEKYKIEYTAEDLDNLCDKKTTFLELKKGSIKSREKTKKDRIIGFTMC